MSDDDNISETQAQLEMIETALKQDPTNSDLLQLQSELKQLLALLSPDDSASENTEISPPGCSVVQDLSKLEGQKVRAPVRDGGDCNELGNAVILGLEAGHEDTDEVQCCHEQ